MNEQLLTYNQTFSLKPETLEKRIMEYYQETQKSSLTIKYMNTKATRTMKRFFYYFKDYFMESEWKRLTLRVFPLRNFGKKVVSAVRSLISAVRPEETTET